jgi:F-type H+-transporting ATPase subunit b
MADILTVLAAAAEHAAEHGGEHAEPLALGLAPASWIVAAAMTVLILVALFLKVPKMLTSSLDASIAEIKKQLDEAKVLRAEAEALRDEYRRKVAGAEKDAEAMLANAQREADTIVAKAEEDSKAMVERRKRMAEDKIAAAEREAVENVRAHAASAAAAAARKLIAEKHDADADRKLADDLIAGI